MKRLPQLMSIFGVVALSASLAYWALQWFTPQQRPLASAPPAAAPELNLNAAAGLFGGQPLAAAVSNYQLRGVVASGGADSVAIIAADGKPARALPLGAEVAPGVTVRQVEPRFVLLAEGGALRRIELMSAESAKAGAMPAGAVQAGGAVPAPVPPPMMSVTPATPGSAEPPR